MSRRSLSNGDPSADRPLFRNILVAVVPHWECDAGCRHCFVPARLRKARSRPKGFVAAALSQLPEDIRAVGFTGGEPFVHPYRLMRLVEIAARQNRFSSVVTNGLWFDRVKSPERLLQKLYDAGLRRISISIDAYHRPPLSDERIIALIETARKLGMAVNIRGAGKLAEKRGRKIVKTGVLDGQEVAIHFFGLENVGQAARLPRDRKRDRKKLESCLVATQPLVWPDGKVLACCSAHMFRIRNDVLEIGCLKEEPLDKILDRSRRSYLLAALAAGGPIWLREILGRKTTPRAIGDRTRCELCLEILNNPAEVAELRRRIASSKELRKEIAGRMMVWEHCYRPELLPQFQSGV